MSADADAEARLLREVGHDTLLPGRIIKPWDSLPEEKKELWREHARWTKAHALTPDQVRAGLAK